MYVHDIRLQLAIRLVGHPRNEVRDLVLKDVEDMFAIKMDPLNKEKKNANSKHVSNTLSAVCETFPSVRSPSKSPNDPRFATKRAKAKNMIPSTISSKHKKTRVLNYDE